MDTSIFDRRESTVRSYCRSFSECFDTAIGSNIVDTKGRKYIDFLSGCSSLNYGHSDPDMQQALVEYIARNSIAQGLDLHTAAKTQFLETFERLILEPRNMPHKVQFTGPTGTNAVEAALKLARLATGRSNVVSFTNGYHGMTLGALSATGNKTSRLGTEQPMGGVTRALYDGYLGADVDTAVILDRILSDPSSGVDEPAAILVETVQGEGGLTAASAQWLRSIAEIAKSHGALLIVDDIQAGCGRTGSFFSFDEIGLKPDLITLSKSLSGYGLPLAVLLIDPAIDIWKPGQHNGTFRGNNMAFVTARIALEKFWSCNTLMEKVDRDSRTVTNTLNNLSQLIPGSQLKGRGMFLGLDVQTGDLANSICKRAFELGLIIETSGAYGQVVKVLAPLTTPPETLAEGLDILHTAVEDVLASSTHLKFA